MPIFLLTTFPTHSPYNRYSTRVCPVSVPHRSLYSVNRVNSDSTLSIANRTDSFPFIFFIKKFNKKKHSKMKYLWLFTLLVLPSIIENGKHHLSFALDFSEIR